MGEDYNPTNGAASGTFLIANDGDGWDPDPSDPGDWMSTTRHRECAVRERYRRSSSWHGTRVVGVYGAITNNGVGIAGMTWGAWILPVRALGKGGGYDSDIIAGIEWAAGLPVTNPDGPPVPTNPYPADIVNLSLGGERLLCPSDYEDALAQVTAMGVLVVVSAGNGGAPGAARPSMRRRTAARWCRASWRSSGLRNVGTKVGYSSFGARASIAAPAGNCVQTCGRLPALDRHHHELGHHHARREQLHERSECESRHELLRAHRLGHRRAHALGELQSHSRATGRRACRRAPVPFPAGAAGVPTCPTTDPSSGECVCPNDGSQCGAGMVNALSAVKAAQRPIGVIVIPKNIAPGAVFDASCERRRMQRQLDGAGAARHRLLRLDGVSVEPHRERCEQRAGDRRSRPRHLDLDRDRLGRKHRHRDRHAHGDTAASSAPDLRGSSATRLSRGHQRCTPAPPTVSAGVLSGDDGDELAVDAHRHAVERQRLRADAIELRHDAAGESHRCPPPAPATTTCAGAAASLTYHVDVGDVLPRRTSRPTAIAPSRARRDRDGRELHRLGGGAGAHDRSGGGQQRRRHGDPHGDLAARRRAAGERCRWLDILFVAACCVRAAAAEPRGGRRADAHADPRRRRMRR